REAQHRQVAAGADAQPLQRLGRRGGGAGYPRARGAGRGVRLWLRRLRAGAAGGAGALDRGGAPRRDYPGRGHRASVVMDEILPYPFLAIVGQAELKTALVLALVNPRIGG